MRTLIIDPRVSGISGDMLLSALVDLTGEYNILDEVVNAINALENCRKINIEIEDVDAGIKAKRLKIDLEEKRLSDPLKLRDSTHKVVRQLDLSACGERLITQILDDLIWAEAKLHGSNFHLHEIASLDTIIDIVGVVAILDESGMLGCYIYSTPPALGGGYIKTEHGLVSCPAPATLEILRRHSLPYSNIQLNAELTTPTGAAILSNIVNEFVECFPPLVPKRIGYGTGSRKIEGIVNVLRVLEGEESRIEFGKIVLLETNIDDVTGEVVGHLINKLLSEGAVDVFVTQAIGKKNRPVNIVSVISDPINYQKLLEVLVEETGTLGVRIHEIPRFITNRKKKTVKIEIKGKKFGVTLKYSDINGKIVNIKPEYEDLKRISEELKLPLRFVSKIIDEKIANEILSNLFKN